MSLEDQLRGPSRRLLANETGRPVVLANEQVDRSVEPDEYGDYPTTETRIETRAEFEFPGSPQFQSRVGGDEVDVDALIFVPSNVGEDAYTDPPGGPPPGVFSGDETDVDNPTQVLDQRSGREYTVRYYVDEHNGRARLHGVR